MGTRTATLMSAALIALLLFSFGTSSAAPGDAELVKSIPDAHLAEDTILAGAFDLSEHFSGTGLSYHYTSSGGNIQASISTGGVVDLSPAPDWYGSEDLVFYASSGDSVASGTVTVTVSPVNDPPAVASQLQPLFLAEGQTLTLLLGDHFRDVDDELDFTVTASLGNVEAIVEGGTLTLTSGHGWYGTEELAIRATDGTYAVMGTTTVTVLPVNNRPQAVTDSLVLVLVLDEDTSSPGAFDLDQYFTDLDSDLTFHTDGGENLDVAIHEDGKLDVLPKEDWYGQETVVIRAYDGEFDAELDLTVTVRPVNDPPVPANPQVVLELGGSKDLVMYLDDYITDADGEILDLEVSGNRFIEVTLDPATNTAVISNPRDWVGTETIIFTATDASGQSASFAVRVGIAETAGQILSNVLTYIAAAAVCAALIAGRLRLRGSGRRAARGRNPIHTRYSKEDLRGDD